MLGNGLDDQGDQGQQSLAVGIQSPLDDLEFILAQIKIAEAHAAGTPLSELVVDPHLPFGLRTVDGTYNNLIEGVQLLPALLLFHDLGGISSANTPNFVSGRKTLYALLDVELNQNLKLNLQYQFYTGGGIYNVLNDRDNLALSVTYAF